MKRLVAITSRINGKTKQWRDHSTLKSHDGFVEIDHSGNKIVKITRWMDKAA